MLVREAIDTVSAQTRVGVGNDYADTTKTTHTLSENFESKFRYAGVARAEQFSFSKNRRGLNFEYFFLKICRILQERTIANKKKFEMKSCLIFFFKFPKMAKKVFI